VAEVGQFQKEGVLCVEMEAAALFSIAKFREVSLSSLLFMSDDISGFVWDPQFHSEDYRKGRNLALDAAVSAANFGAFMNQGQICMSTERIVVEKSVANEFAKKLAAKGQSLKMGDPMDPQSQIGCMITPAAVERVQSLVDDAVAKGAKVLCGGKAEGPCYPPTVVYGVTPAMRMYHEESFGPAKPVVIATDAEDALRIANDTPYGLSSAVFTRDVNKALRMAEKLEFGICHINGATVHDEPQMPFGGEKDSGYGRFGGRAGLDEFTELRWITIRRSPTPYPI
jgi:acyl-CoA reductase-like NAD-dependent aldehyde dehydrogenase